MHWEGLYYWKGHMCPRGLSFDWGEDVVREGGGLG